MYEKLILDSRDHFKEKKKSLASDDTEIAALKTGYYSVLDIVLSIIYLVYKSTVALMFKVFTHFISQMTFGQIFVFLLILCILGRICIAIFKSFLRSLRIIISVAFCCYIFAAHKQT